MANTTTLGDLATRALDFADMTNSQFPVTSRVYEYINDALAHLHDVLINANQDFFKTVQTVNLVAGTSQYALPSDYYRTLKVYYQTSNRLFKVDKWNMDEIDGYRTGPISTGTLQHWYIPQFVPLANSSSVVDSVLPNGWERFVALRAAVDLLVRQRTGANELMAMADRELQRLIQMAEPRDVGEEDCIGDSYNRWNDNRHVTRIEARYFKYRVIGDNMEVIETEYLGV